ncbi:MAG: iron ABC transporter permease [Treponema sp.]|uniref:FecCD family ABC transporter permease n=1 Tax=Treponema sp. TaxID=166 RepID=UPI0025F7C54C|nr:iron ABC transporter permease [Treponema sp.]MBQ8681000.1 iron ABC transporter permease [Treponema sp.]
MFIQNKNIRSLFILVSFLMIPLVAIICLGIGRYSLSPFQIISSFVDALFGGDGDVMAKTVIFKVRLPRILLALVAGAGLACSGTAFQGLFSNPLATPDTLGVASGASFGAVLAMMFHWNLIGIQALALCFGLISCFLTCQISRIKGKSSIIMIILSGMVISSLFQALVSIVKYIADPEDELPSITYWLMGSMSSVTYKSLLFGVPFIIIGLVVIWALKWRLNILSLNEDEAKSMGMNIKMIRLLIIVASSLITASVISMCGQIGWVGLLIPHISRMLLGSNNKTVVPLSISFGAIFMAIIDTFARSASSAEIPISILTAIIGAPVFISLLRKTGGVWA